MKSFGLPKIEDLSTFEVDEKPLVCKETQKWGIGPLDVDVTMCRKGGWTEKQINGFCLAVQWELLNRLRDVVFARPDLYDLTATGVLVFTEK